MQMKNRHRLENGHMKFIYVDINNEKLEIDYENMGCVIDKIDNELSQWMNEQPVFFVATAPLSAEGHVNCSPKGGDCFVVLGEHRVAYLDYTGSGAETIAHLRENGRIVIMFCAFNGKPKIVRLHGKGRAVVTGDPEFDSLLDKFPANPGARSVILIDVDRISSSCGFSVPFMDYVGDRDTLDKWAESKGSDGLSEYRKRKNAASIDGLPAIE